MSNWIIQQPIWWIPMGILFTALMVWWLYGKKNSSYPAPYPLLLAILRALALLLVLLLLFNPLLKKTEQRLEQPALVLAIDASSSITSGKDSATRLAAVEQSVQAIQDQLSDRYEIDVYHFGSQTRLASVGNDLPAFNDLQTDISNLLDETGLQYEGRNLKGIILMSDGLYNKGQNPVYLAGKSRAPIFSIGLGDSIERKDLRIAALRTNSLVYSGNRFPIEIDVQGIKTGSSEVLLEIADDQEVLYRERIRGEGERWMQTVSTLLEAKELGNKRYRLRLGRLDQEVSYANNQREFYIEVLDARQKLLMLASAPGPDVAALRRSIERSSNYELEVRSGSAAEWKAGESFDLIIVYGLGNDNRHANWTSEWNRQKQNWLGILSTASNGAEIGKIESGLRIGGMNNSYNESSPYFNPAFAYFELDETLLARLKSMPPLKSPYGTYQTDDANGSLLLQRIGSVKTQYPLIYLQNRDGMRKGLVAGEGMWRWQLHEYDEYGDHAFTDHLSGKIIQFLTLKSDRRPFRVQPLKRKFGENESVQFTAEAYDENYQPTNTPDVKLELRSEDGKKYDFQFSRQGNAYQLKAGILPAGRYQYVASSIFGGREQKAIGEIVISKLEVEKTETAANFRLLRSLAEQTGGQFCLPGELESLFNEFQKEERQSSISYQNIRFLDLIHFQWMLFAITLLLAAEWAIRRWLGSY